MDIALCLLNGERYDIASFSKLNSTTLSKLRRVLVCKDCGGKGYYRKKSTDGKAACFGAYHEDNCPHKQTESTPKIDPKTVEEVNEIITNSDTIDVNFITYSANQLKTPNNRKSSTTHTSSSTSSKRHTRKPIQKRNALKGLRSLLRMLMHSDSFASSNIKINTGYKYPYNAKNFFVNFDNINEKLVNDKKMRGYWGVISHADDDINWLNTANKQDVSIPVSDIKKNLIDTFEITNAEDLSGAAVLVCGWLDISKSSTKWYISVHRKDPAYIFIKLKK